MLSMLGLVIACTTPPTIDTRRQQHLADSDGDTAVAGDTADTTDTGTAAPPLPAAGPRGLLVAQSWDREPALYGDGAGQYRVIFLQESMHSLLPAIRAANPDAVVLAYQKAGGMRPDGGDTPSTGVQTHEAQESWFLHGPDGERLRYCDYPVDAANIGDKGYQQRWLDNVRTRLREHGFDGVMMDDVNTFPGHCLGSQGTPIAEYPSDAAYGDAVVDFVNAVGPGLLEAGLLVAPNVAMNPWDETMRAQTEAMFPAISHLTREYWMRWDDSPNFTGDEWLQTLTLMEDAEAAGIGFLGLTYGPGVEGAAHGQRYGRASFLLAWDGERDSAWGYLDEDIEPFSDEWGPDIGLPLAPRVPVGVGWRRDYSGGVVLVNPDSSDSQAFSVAGEAITLEPGSALIRPAERER